MACLLAARLRLSFGPPYRATDVLFTATTGGLEAAADNPWRAAAVCCPLPPHSEQGPAGRRWCPVEAPLQKQCTVTERTAQRLRTSKLHVTPGGWAWVCHPCNGASGLSARNIKVLSPSRCRKPPINPIFPRLSRASRPSRKPAPMRGKPNLCAARRNLGGAPKSALLRCCASAAALSGPQAAERHCCRW